MELQEFVRKTILEVISGVREARTEAVKSGACLGMIASGGDIEFDVAVTAGDN
jgi:hypothetical protein